MLLSMPVKLRKMQMKLLFRGLDIYRKDRKVI